MSDCLSVPAYAKINLTLDVGERRTDGYHGIRSVMQTIGLHDTLTVTRTPEAPGVSLDVSGSEAAGVPADASNLVHRAAVRLQKIAAAQGLFRGNQLGLHIWLEKRIPSQAGLGGGSSDAAAALRAVNQMFGLELSLRRLAALALVLGADVPFFLRDGTALVEGFGERVTPLRALSPPWHVVVVKPPVGVSTARAYAALDALPDRVPGHATEDWLSGRSTAMANDFETVILAQNSDIAAAYSFMRDFIANEGGEPPLLCGSGSALFCRVRDAAAAERLAESVRHSGLGRAWATQTVGTETEV